MKRGLREDDIEGGNLERVPTSHATLVARLFAARRKRGGSREDFIDFFFPKPATPSRSRL